MDKFFVALRVYILLSIRTNNFDDCTEYDIWWAFSVYEHLLGVNIG